MSSELAPASPSPSRLEQVVTLLLAAWIGAAVLVAAVVAPAAFAVLPSRTLAGALVGKVLPVLFYSGLVVTLTALVAGPGSRSRRVAIIAAAASCAVAQWIIAPRIASIRSSVRAAIEALATDDPRRVSFGRLHGISVALLGIAMLASAFVLLQTVRRRPVA